MHTLWEILDLPLHLIESGPKLDWTRDVRIYDRYLAWKRCELLCDSILKDTEVPIKYAYLKYWMGVEGVPVIKNWESTNKIVYVTPDGVTPSGPKFETY